MYTWAVNILVIRCLKDLGYNQGEATVYSMYTHEAVTAVLHTQLYWFSLIDIHEGVYFTYNFSLVDARKHVKDVKHVEP